MRINYSRRGNHERGANPLSSLHTLAERRQTHRTANNSIIIGLRFSTGMLIFLYQQCQHIFLILLLYVKIISIGFLITHGAQK